MIAADENLTVPQCEKLNGKNPKLSKIKRDISINFFQTLNHSLAFICVCSCIPMAKNAFARYYIHFGKFLRLLVLCYYSTKWLVFGFHNCGASCRLRCVFCFAIILVALNELLAQFFVTKIIFVLVVGGFVHTWIAWETFLHFGKCLVAFDAFRFAIAVTTTSDKRWTIRETELQNDICPLVIPVMETWKWIAKLDTAWTGRHAAQTWTIPVDFAVGQN